MSRRRTLDLARVKSLIAQGLTASQIRTTLACRRVTLMDFMAVHQLTAVAEPTIKLKDLPPPESDRIPYSSGGDHEFAKRMNGRLFDQIIFKPTGVLPLHKPHRVPGDDHSSHGSSLRHIAGDTGKRAGGMGRS